MKKYKYIIIIVGVLLSVVIAMLLSPSEQDNTISTEVKEGSFLISISTNGELDSKNSTVIKGPRNIRSLGIYQNLKINNIIEEGTIVDSGDYIASIDQTPLLSKMKDVDANLEKLSAKINQSKLDSALVLRADRDNIVNLEYDIHELEVELRNSEYESPVTKEKLRISLEKANRKYKQSLDNYELKREKQDNIVHTAVIDYQKEADKKSRFLEVLREFTITAPQSGMLIYVKTWSGRKITSGSELSSWDPRVAKLPDLTQMVVKTYVNEVDISKVVVGQKVNIGVDAFPDKSLEGIVTTVANIGEEMKNTSAHVFEVVINVESKDSDLRPAMTTKNKVIIEVLDSVLYLPIECINTEDSISFVYSKGKKIQVEAGKSNQDEIVVLKGLKAGQSVYLVPPEGSEKWSLELL